MKTNFRSKILSVLLMLVIVLAFVPFSALMVFADGGRFSSEISKRL